MPFQARHPDETALHSEIRDALNSEIQSKNFFVWLNILPTGQGSEIDDLPGLVAETEEWLRSLDPDAVSEKELPKRVIKRRAAIVELTALPRKPEVRSYPADQIVGNPGPILVGWNE